MYVCRFFNYPPQVFRPIVKRLGVEFDCDIVRRLVNLTHSDNDNVFITYPELIKTTLFSHAQCLLPSGLPDKMFQGRRGGDKLVMDLHSCNEHYIEASLIK